MHFKIWMKNLIALYFFCLIVDLCVTSTVIDSERKDPHHHHEGNMDTLELIDEYEAPVSRGDGEDGSCRCPRRKTCGESMSQRRKESSSLPLCDLAGARKMILIPPLQGGQMPFQGQQQQPYYWPPPGGPSRSFSWPSQQTPSPSSSSIAPASSSSSAASSSPSSSAASLPASTSSAIPASSSSVATSTSAKPSFTRPSSFSMTKTQSGNTSSTSSSPSSSSAANTTSSAGQPTTSKSASSSSAPTSGVPTSSSVTSSGSVSPTSSAATSTTGTSGGSNTTSGSGSTGGTNTSTGGSTGGGGTNDTSSGGSGGSGGVTCSSSEFTNAVTSNSFPAPSDAQYKAFINGIPKSGITTKRELAMFLAQILHESDGLRATEEYACKDTNCPGQYDYSPDGKHHYYGRGYIQLTWSANYKSASQDLYGDPNVLLNAPEDVATDQDKAWGVSFNYWKTKVHTAPGVTDGQFGAATNAINGPLECSGGSSDKANIRFQLYVNVMKAFGITETPNPAGCGSS